MMLKHLNLETIFQLFIKRKTAITYSKEDKVIRQALECLEERIKYHSDPLEQPLMVRQYLQLQLAQEQNEVFAVLFLSNHHRVLAFEKLFFGTINSVSVHSRIVMQRALFHNAAAVILAHNHPTGNLEPSAADQYITQQLIVAMRYMDVRVLDHIIVSFEGTLSFADRGLI